MPYARPMRLRTATATASFRDCTEDRFAIHQMANGLVTVVADGAGGIPGGGFAADLLLKIVARAVADASFDPFAAATWTRVLHDADREIERAPRAGETTAVIVAVRADGGLVGVSAGDSAAILVGEHARPDGLTDQQHRKRRLGSGRASPVPFLRPTFAGTLVVATDGLVGYVRPDVIARVITETPDLSEAADALIDRARLPNGDLHDDVVVVLVQP